MATVGTREGRFGGEELDAAAWTGPLGGAPAPPNPPGTAIFLIFNIDMFVMCVSVLAPIWWIWGQILPYIIFHYLTYDLLPDYHYFS